MSRFLNNIVLVGVGGAGMSAIAGMLHDLGYTNIIGIDSNEGEIVKKLIDKGIKVIIGHGKYEVQEKDFVIYSDIEAIKKTPEIQQSLKIHKTHTKYYHRPYTYSEFIAEITKHFITVAITGTNGKSSTTGLMIHTLAEENEVFGLGIVGALMPDHNNNNYLLNTDHKDTIKLSMDHIVTGVLSPIENMKKQLFIIEACEHKEHFLLYDVDYAIITNVGYDHQDYFPTEEDYLRSFRQFVHGVKKNVVVMDEETKEKLTLSEKIVSEKVLIAEEKNYNFKKIFGSHRGKNASMIQCLLSKIENIESGNDQKQTEQKEQIESFSGLRRRMELLGASLKGAKIYSDYGHHPDAIAHAINALKKEYTDKKLIAYIEPHQSQRLLGLRDDFIKTMKKADEVIVFKLYTARETFSMIQKEIEKRKKEGVNNFEELGGVFAKEIGGSFFIEEDKVRQDIEKREEDTVCVIFSAGRLDYLIRTRIGGE